MAEVAPGRKVSVSVEPVIYDSFDHLGDLTAVNGRRFQQILDIGDVARRKYPVAWANAHRAPNPEGGAFVRLWAAELRVAGIYAGVNGKRGSDEQSQDVLTFPVRNGGNDDTSGRGFPRILIVDVIAGAGGPDPSLTFNDVSQFSPGKFLDVGETGPLAPPVPPGVADPDPALAPPGVIGAPRTQTVVTREEWEATMQRLGGLERAVQAAQAAAEAARAETKYLVDHTFNDGDGRISLLAHLDDIKRMVAGLPRDPRFG